MLETSFFILSLAFLILVVSTAAVFWQMWRAAKNMTAVLETLNQSLPEIMENMKNMSKNVNSASVIIHNEVESLAVFGSKIRTVLEIGETAERILLMGIKPSFIEGYKTLRGILKGVRVFFDVLTAK